jgi:outer membrane protein assembly factor BamB
MSNLGRWFCSGCLILVAGCSGPCCANPTPEEKAAPDENVEVKPVGPNSVPLFGGTISRNLANTVEKGIPSEWSIEKGKHKNVKWVAKLGDHSFGGPVVAGGRIFVGTNNESPRDPAIKGDKGVLMCFRESDGKFLWQIVHDKNDEHFDAQWHGVLSSPAVDGDRLYYVSNRCELVCADVAGDTATGKGKIVWSLDMIKELKVYPGGLSGSASNSSPLVIGDLVYVLTSNGTDSATQKAPSPKAPTLIAVNKKTGKVVWSDNSPGAKIMDGQWSSPVAAEANGEMLVMYGGGDGWIYAFEATRGEVRWKFDCNPKAAVFQAGGRGDRSYIVGTPVVHEQKLYIGVGNEPCSGDGVGRLWCIDITKKPANKDKDVSPFSTADDKNPKFDPKDPRNRDSALVWHHGGLVVPRPERARDKIFGRTISTCAVYDGLVYAAEMTGFLQCLDAKTGQQYWKQDLNDATWSSPYYVDGKVFLGTTQGGMLVFRYGKTLKKPTRIEMDGSVHVPPVACNGVLYITNGTHLYAIAAK